MNKNFLVGILTWECQVIYLAENRQWTNDRSKAVIMVASSFEAWKEDADLFGFLLLNLKGRVLYDSVRRKV